MHPPYDQAKFAYSKQNIEGVTKKTSITTAPLSSLKPITISQLKINQNHEGFYLKLKIKFAFRAVATIIMTKLRQFKQKFANLSSKAPRNEQKIKIQNLHVETIKQVLNANDFSNAQITSLFNSSKRQQKMIYSKACIINHQCEYNCDRINVGLSIVVYSTSFIKKGEELFITYLANRDYIKRNKQLNNWGIDCKCTMCQYQHSVMNKRPIKKESLVIKYHEIIRKGLFNIKQMMKITCSLSLVNEMIGEGLDSEANIMLARIFPMKNEEINLLRFS